MTIVEAVKIILQQAQGPLTVGEIYPRISEVKTYEILRVHRDYFAAEA